MDICIPIFELSRTGGIERYTYEVGAELAHRGHSVTFVAPATDASLPQGTQLDRVRALRTHNTVLRVVDFSSFGFRGTHRVRKRSGNEVVYRPVGGSFGPGVVTAHSCHAAWVRARPGGHRLHTSLFDRMFLFQERLTFRNPEVRVSTVSTQCADQIAEMYPIRRADIVVAPPAVNSRMFPRRTLDERRRARASFDLAPDRMTIGLVANHGAQCKRVDMMIRAASRLDATLLVAGHFDVASEARSIVASTDADVRFVGLVDDMHGFYSSLDVFAQPSIMESYGMAAHEAMAVGIPTVVSSTCGIASHLEPGRHALVVDHDDLDALVERLAALRDDSLRQTLAAAGATWAHGRAWSDVVDDLMPLLNSERSELELRG